ncbi:MAG: Stk1 family PASTA domain-containing Ser/Thr kinase [Oscillospiraceae bacterium]|nr:Stk1 family PASTA domain-containing Ser/Thr kinase [Oscillospiraceae bacterium]
MDKYIGKKLDGRYEITELIGIGGMAEVYKALDLMENRVVAVKILKNEYAGNADFVRRFRNESKAIAVLSHPNIVKIYDVGFSDKIQFIVMEYIDGVTLKEFMEQQGALKWKDSVHFIIQVLRALQHAHDRGIVHRDIKPQNIMLFPDGTIKVMDFGIARFAREEGKTISDKAIGSVHYISPEQARGDITDEKSDIYSVGVMLYEMLTGVKPFDADTPVAVAVMHMQSNPRLPRTINDTIPEGLESIVIRAMQRDAGRRYQSASEMIKDIEEFKRNPSIVFEYSYPESEDEGKTIYFDKPAHEAAAKAGGKAAAAARYAEVKSQGGKGSAHGKNTDSKKNEVRNTKPNTKANEYYDYDDDDEDEEVSKSSYFVVALTAIAAAVVIIAVVFIAIQIFINIGSGTDETQPMVNLVGYDFNQCKSTYASYFNLTVDKEIYSSDYPAGVIIEHSPKEGSLIVVGNAEVRATVSKGPQMVTVPNTYSVDANTAGAMIEGVGLFYTYVMQYSDVEKNTVIKTEPERNEEVERGSTVFVYVSRGPEQFDKFVPDVEGLTRAEAVERLEKEGFTVQLQEQDSPENKDVVLHQSVPHLDDNGQPNIVSYGTTIILTYSSGVVPMSTVNITFAVPDGLTGKATFNAYVNGILSGTHEVDNIGYVQTISIEVEGKDTQKVVIEAVGSDGRAHSMAEYNVDFNNKSVSESRFDRDLLKTLYGIPEETPAVTDADVGFIEDEFPEIPADPNEGDDPQIIGTGSYESWWDQITNGQ